MESKMDCFRQLLSASGVKDNPKLTAFVLHEMELLQKKQEGWKTPTKNALLNDLLKEEIYNHLCKQNKPLTISRIIQTNPKFTNLTNQKVCALVRILIDEKRVNRIDTLRGTKFEAVA